MTMLRYILQPVILIISMVAFNYDMFFVAVSADDEKKQETVLFYEPFEDTDWESRGWYDGPNMHLTTSETNDSGVNLQEPYCLGSKYLSVLLNPISTKSTPDLECARYNSLTNLRSKCQLFK